jgi:Extracellular link domain
MLPTPTVILVGIAGLMVAVVIVYVSTQSILSVLVVFTLAGILGYVLHKMGFLNLSISGNGIDISFFEKSPSPSPSRIATHIPIETKEVFYVSGNEYTYDESAAVCAAYGADLATYDEVNDAYSKGAEWCGYGWTQGGMALFPTQQATWELLQQEVDASKRTACGRPGINGGYFDASMKFGVNCYGMKPKGGTVRFPLPIPGTDPGTFDKLVNKFKSMLKKMTVSPFNRDEWSEWNVTPKTNELRSGHPSSTKFVHSK